MAASLFDSDKRVRKMPPATQPGPAPAPAVRYSGYRPNPCERSNTAQTFIDAAPFEGRPPAPWSTKMRELIAWFESTFADWTPATFHLRTGQIVHDPAAYLAAIRADIAAGRRGPRGDPPRALRADLRRLRELFGGPSPIQLRPRPR